MVISYISHFMYSTTESGSTPKMRLDSFLARNTSEDSASFAEILKESEIKHRHKHQWLFDKEKEHLAVRLVYCRLSRLFNRGGGGGRWQV